MKAELEFEARKSPRTAVVMQALERFFAPLTSLPFDDACARQYAFIRADLERAGTPIGANDLMIAAIARKHALTVVTHDVREFTASTALRSARSPAPSARSAGAEAPSERHSVPPERG